MTIEPRFDIFPLSQLSDAGFKVRRGDLHRVLQTMDGKVFPLTTMHLLIEHSRIEKYRVR